MNISPYCRLVLVPPISVKLGIRGQLTDVITCVKNFFWGAPHFSFAPPLPPKFWGSNELAVVIGLSKAKHISKHSHVGELVTVLYKHNKLDNYNKIYY